MLSCLLQKKLPQLSGSKQQQTFIISCGLCVWHLGTAEPSQNFSQGCRQVVSQSCSHLKAQLGMKDLFPQVTFIRYWHMGAGLWQEASLPPHLGPSNSP